MAAAQLNAFYVEKIEYPLYQSTILMVVELNTEKKQEYMVENICIDG